MDNKSKVLIYTSGIICVAMLAATLALTNGNVYKNDEFLFIVGEKGAVAAGILLGFLFNLAKVSTESRRINECADVCKNRERAALSYLMWFVLAGAVLSVSMLILHISFLGTFLGILSLKLSELLFCNIRHRNKKQVF